MARRGPAPVVLAVLIALVAVPRTAEGHLVTSGGGPFWDGFVHFYVSPGDFLPVLALALFSGLAGKKAARGLVRAFPIAWLLGTIVGFQATNFTDPEFPLSGVSMLCTGLLLGTNLKLPTRWLILTGVVVGVLHGFMNGVAIAATGTSGLAAIGNVVAASTVALLLSAAVVSLSKSWQLIAVRVVGSWVAAIGLLALAWQFRSGS